MNRVQNWAFGIATGRERILPVPVLRTYANLLRSTASSSSSRTTG